MYALKSSQNIGVDSDYVHNSYVYVKGNNQFCV